MTKNKTMATAALATCLLAGCGGEGEPRAAVPEKPQDPVVARMHDKEYVAKLDKQIAARKAIMREMSMAKKRLEEAEAGGATGAELAALSNALKAASQKIRKNHAESVVLVSQQMKNSAAAAQANKELQHKGE